MLTQSENCDIITLRNMKLTILKEVLQIMKKTKLTRRIAVALLTVVLVLCPVFAMSVDAGGSIAYTPDPATWSLPWAKTEAEYDNCDIYEASVGSTSHETTSRTYPRLAMDIYGDNTCSVYSPCGGRIVYCGASIANKPTTWYFGDNNKTEKWGNFIVIEYNAAGDRVMLAHLSSLSSTLNVGDQINPGDYIGKMGNTGNAGSNTVLHFELLDIIASQVNGNYVLCGRTLYNWRNSSKNGDMPSLAASCTHSFTIKEADATHTANGHRVLYFCSKCGASDGIVHDEWALSGTCAICTPGGGAGDNSLFIVFVTNNGKTIYTNDIFEIVVRTTSSSESVAVFDEYGTMVAYSTSPDQNLGEILDWNLDIDAGSKTGVRNYTIRTYRGGYYYDRPFSFKVVNNPANYYKHANIIVAAASPKYVEVDENFKIIVRTGADAKRVTVFAPDNSQLATSTISTLESQGYRSWLFSFMAEAGDLGLLKLKVSSYDSAVSGAPVVDSEYVKVNVIKAGGGPVPGNPPAKTGIIDIYLSGSPSVNNKLIFTVLTSADIDEITAVNPDTSRKIGGSDKYVRMDGLRAFSFTYTPTKTGKLNIEFSAYSDDAGGTVARKRYSLNISEYYYTPVVDDDKVSDYVERNNGLTAYQTREASVLGHYVEETANGDFLLHIICNSNTVKVSISETSYFMTSDIRYSYTQTVNGRDFGTWKVIPNEEVIINVRAYDAAGNCINASILVNP